MKILIITNSFPTPLHPTHGIFILEQIKALKKLGHEIEVINPLPRPFLGKFKGNDTIPEKDNLFNITAHHPKYYFIPGKKMLYHSTKEFVRQGMKYFEDKIFPNFKPDLVHSHWITPSGLLGQKIAEKIGVRHFCSVRGSDVYKYPDKHRQLFKISKEILNKSDRIITVSNKLKIDTRKKFDLNSDKIKVIYNGVDFTKFTLKNEKNINENIDKNFKILFIGNLIPQKGIRELLTSIENVLAIHENIELKIIGDGPLLKYIKNRIEEKGLTNHIHLIGKVNHSLLPDFYNNSDLVVLPSYSEGLPNVLVEAIACGTKVIGSNVGGIPEVIKNKRFGSIVEPQNEKSLINAILLMLNKIDYLKFQQADIKWFKESFNIEDNVKKIDELYRNVR